MGWIQGQLRGFGNRIRTSQTVWPVVFAVVIGAGAGLGCLLLRHMLEGVHWFFFAFLGDAMRNVLGSWYTVPILAAGGLIVGIINQFFAAETKGHGVPNVMFACAFRGGRIHPKAMLLKAVAAAVTIGSGGSAGLIGPVVRIGSAFGSAVGQVLRLPDRRIVLSVACGAAGGIAATFNAPIAGAIFALEVILGRFTALSFGLIVISSASATVVSHTLVGDFPAFIVAQSYPIQSYWEIPLFAVMGIMCGAVSRGYSRLLYAVDGVADRSRLPEYLKPAIGAALVGLIAMHLPQALSLGYGTIEDALNNAFVIETLALLCVAKLVCTALTLGSGGSGGIFAPALFIGAMFGGAYGNVMGGVFPELASTPGAYALVGMAALFAGATHAPITAIFIIFEMTDEEFLILPLMTATVLSSLTAQRLSPDSIYTTKLRRQGIDVGVVQELNIMDTLTVADAMKEEFEFVSPDLPVDEVLTKLTTGRLTSYPVLDDEGVLVGMVAMEDLERTLAEGDPRQLVVKDICTTDVVVCRPDQTLSSAMALFATRHYARLPVVDPDRPERIIGMLQRSDVIAAYAEAHKKTTEMIKRVDEIQTFSERSGTVLVEGTLTAGSQLAGKHVREVGFPAESTLVAIRRGAHTIIPGGPTRLEPGDTIEVLAARDKASALRRWMDERC